MDETRSALRQTAMEWKVMMNVSTSGEWSSSPTMLQGGERGERARAGTASEETLASLLFFRLPKLNKNRLHPACGQVPV